MSAPERGQDHLARGVAAIAADRERGATDLAREALDVLRRAIEDGVDRLPHAAAALARARPGMAAIRNVVLRVVEDPESTRSATAAADACRRARTWLDEASRRAVEGAALAIPPGALVVTCSYSSAVVRACGSAPPGLRVRALESSTGGLAYGERLAAALSQRGVPCEVAADARLAEALRGATLVLVGADRVLPDGALVNGSPSLRLAEAARRHAVPFHAICESFKLDDSVPRMEPGLDLIPAALVTAYFTARGPVPPVDVWSTLRGT